MKELIYILISWMLFSCSSTPTVSSKATCTIKKHSKDDLYQVLIDEKPINNRWYLRADASEIKIILGVRNKCKRM